MAEASEVCSLCGKQGKKQKITDSKTRRLATFIKQECHSMSCPSSLCEGAGTRLPPTSANHHLDEIENGRVQHLKIKIMGYTEWVKVTHNNAAGALSSVRSTTQ